MEEEKNGGTRERGGGENKIILIFNLFCDCQASLDRRKSLRIRTRVDAHLKFAIINPRQRSALTDPVLINQKLYILVELCVNTQLH